MQYSAKGLRVVVTAGAAGIGRAIVRTFVEQGARVHICDVDDRMLKETASAFPEVTQTRADVASVARLRLAQMHENADLRREVAELKQRLARVVDIERRLNGK